MKVIKPKAKAAKKSTQKKELPPDTYKPLMEPQDLVLDESRKFVCSIQRGGEDGLPCVDVRTFQTTEAYTGFTRERRVSLFKPVRTMTGHGSKCLTEIPCR